jgi:hypothetical protein
MCSFQLSGKDLSHVAVPMERIETEQADGIMQVTYHNSLHVGVGYSPRAHMTENWF